MKPITVSIDVPQSRDDVYAFLDVMPNHERFNDHMLLDWAYSGPDRGVGAKARVHTKTAGKTDTIDIEVIAGDPPRRIVEQNVGANGKRLGRGTFVLDALPGGGTRIAFEYAWRAAPRSERLLAPLVRTVMRGGLRKAMQRLAGQLAQLDTARSAA
jgi:hypothetical protein